MSQSNIIGIKYTILIFILLIPFIIYAQYYSETINPHKEKNWTGCVRLLDGKYDRLDGIMKVGKGSFYSLFRSYAIFDVTYIPDKANIKEIKLILFTDMKALLPNRMIDIYVLDIDPLKAGDKEVFESFNTGTLLISGHKSQNTLGQHIITLNETAFRSLKSCLIKNRWVIGIKQEEAKEAENRSIGDFKGYNSDTTYPFCEVKYSLDYMRTSFDNRNISYIKEINFKKKEITISYWDHKKIDGDIISLYLNGKPVLTKYTLTGEKAKITIELNTDTPNDLFLYAHNEGLNPPNTVSLDITDGITMENIVLSSNLKSCEGILITVNE